MDSIVMLMLSISTMMLISIAVAMCAKKWNVPYTVLLVFVGILLVPLTYYVPFLSFIRTFHLTPEVLFYIFLPVLLFESAYNMKIPRVMENARIIGLMAIGGFLISTFFIATVAYFLFGLVGWPVPFMILLLFGALISATDPVAVLSLFKEYGAPRRLALLFEGESLFNDATAVALFLIILEIIHKGVFNVMDIGHGVVMFLTMMIGGMIFGVIVGGVFSKLLQYAQGANFQITITMLVAHLTFIGAELFSGISFFGTHVHLSPIVATVIAAMIMGNYGKFKIQPEVNEYMDRFWEYFAFVANSLVFLLLGLIFVEIGLSIVAMIVPIILMIMIVIVARALSVYGVLIPFNAITQDEAQKVPMKWQHLLSWGSLRGALAIIMALLIPEDLTISGWIYEISVRDFVLILTAGCIYFTLFIKATTIPGFMSWLKLDKFTELEKMRYWESKAYIHAMTMIEISTLKTKEPIGHKTWDRLFCEAKSRYDKTLDELHKLSDHDTHIAERVLRIYAIGIERRTLEELYSGDEISEFAYKKTLHKLDVQQERLEVGDDEIVGFDKIVAKDAVADLITFVRKLFLLKPIKATHYDRLMYYRALGLLAQAVIDDLTSFADCVYKDLADDRDVVLGVRQTYEQYHKQANKKMGTVLEGDEELSDTYEELLVREALRTQKKYLKNLHNKEMLTPKLYTRLHNELADECDQK